jgi:pimeloyl-ACP methyl ester carboxylesterase
MGFRALLPLAAAMLLPPAPGADLGWEGHWLGTLAAGPVKLRLALHLTQTPAGFAATLDSLDQGAMGLPGKPTVAGRSITVEVPTVAGTFEGNLGEGGREIAGVWKQGAASLPLTFTKVDAVPEKLRPQDPSKPYPYQEEEVVYPGHGVKLTGALTLPRGNGPHPAVLLLTGSGAQDRNESIMGHRPFLVLADYLTRRGFAVLRMDDRGVGGSTGNLSASTEEDLTADALAGVAYLKSRSQIDPRRIALAGHSEGGLVAALAASRSRDVALVVLLAAPGIPGDQIILRQVETAVRGAGLPAGRAAESIAVQRKVLDIVLSEKDDAAALEKLHHTLAPMLALMPESARKAKENELRLATTKWYRSFVATDPRPALAALHAPVLALNGELDTQVRADENLAAIGAALKSGGNRDYRTMKLPGLNHLFQKAPSGAITEYRDIEETINPSVLRIVGDWLAVRALPDQALPLQ